MSQNFPLDLDALEIGEPLTHRSLTVFPILGAAHGPSYITLHEALERKELSVGECAAGARVPELEVTNRSPDLVLILDGEILVGAKQNRSLNTSVLLAPHSKTVVPVSCVEAGRWHTVSSSFDELDAVVPHRVRHAKSRSVTHALRGGSGHRSDQGLVWAEIERKLGRHRVHSPSSSMGELFARKERDLQGYLEALRRRSDQRGLVAAIGGAWIAADLLSRPSAYAQVHRRLLKGYAAEDLEGPELAPPLLEKENAREFLRQIARGKPSRHPGVGLGEELRFAGERGQGLALVLEETTVHAVFLAEREVHGDEGLRGADAPILRRSRRIV